jgi:hypothetical protein
MLVEYANNRDKALLALNVSILGESLKYLFQAMQNLNNLMKNLLILR